MRRAALGLLAWLCAAGAHGHPLGNNTVNRAAAIQVSREVIAVRYAVDVAEIPTLLAVQDADADNDGSVSPSEWEGYARRRSAEIVAGIEIVAGGAPLPVRLVAMRWRLVPGAAGLDSLLLELELSASLRGYQTARIDYRDRRRPEEVGWKEVVAAAGAGVEITHADVPRTSASGGLTAYPEPGGAVPNVLSATIEVKAAPVSASATTRAQAPATASNDPVVPPRGAGVDATRSPESVTDAPVRLSGPAESPPSARPSAPPPPRNPGPQIAAFFRLGVHHIATGWDHLVFLLGLIVARASLRRLVWVVTAFTVAHSLTLGLAASGLVAAPGRWVEPAIALTIAYVGLTNLLGWSRHGAPIAFAFGLVHGFGFAGALAESLDGAQIGGSAWLLDLAAFNLGIEIFQLGLILVVGPLLRWAARQSWSGTAQQATNAAILCAGLGWLAARL